MSALTITSVKGKFRRNLAPCSVQSCGRSGTNKVLVAGWTWDKNGGLFCAHHAKELQQLWNANLDKPGSAGTSGAPVIDSREKTARESAGAPVPTGRKVAA